MAVFQIAPANVLHGAVRLHGLTSSPTPETQVRVACPNAAAGSPTTTNVVMIATRDLKLMMPPRMTSCRPWINASLGAPRYIGKLAGCPQIACQLPGVAAGVSRVDG